MTTTPLYLVAHCQIYVIYRPLKFPTMEQKSIHSIQVHFFFQEPIMKVPKSHVTGYDRAKKME